MGLEQEEFEDDASEAAECARLARINGQRKPVPGAPWFDKLADVGTTDDDDGDWERK